MKSIASAFVVLCLGCASVCAAGPINFGLQATVANIKIGGTFQNAYGFGFGGGAHVDVDLPVLSFRVQGDFIPFAPDNAKFRNALAADFSRQGLPARPTDFIVEGGRINVLSLLINTKLTPFPIPIVSPYITAGAGLTNIGASDANVKYSGSLAIQNTTLSAAKSEASFTANGGAGVNVNVSVFSLYIEARYNWIFSERETIRYIPVSLGITF